MEHGHGLGPGCVTAVLIPRNVCSAWHRLQAAAQTLVGRRMPSTSPQPGLRWLSTTFRPNSTAEKPTALVSTGRRLQCGANA